MCVSIFGMLVHDLGPVEVEGEGLAHGGEGGPLADGLHPGEGGGGASPAVLAHVDQLEDVLVRGVDREGQRAGPDVGPGQVPAGCA